MKHISELRDRLSTLFSNLEKNAVDVDVAKEMNNTANRIIGTVRMELIGRKLTNDLTELPFVAATHYAKTKAKAATK